MNQDKDPLDQGIDFSTAKRGPVLPPDQTKTRITIRLDSAVIDWFKNQPRTGGYQNRINNALLDYIARSENGERYKKEELKEALAEVLAQEHAA